MRTWRNRREPAGRVERLLAELRPHVDDDRVLEAIGAVQRERFVPADLRAEAWDNIALPIGSGQTISQPLVVARMCELLALHGDERVLDIGTGSGYHAAVLARLAAHVWSVELHPELSERAAATLAAAGIANVTLLTGDGSLGHPAEAPYDAINVAAAMAGIPPALPAQLAEHGRLVGPVDSGDQRLVLLRREAGGVREERHERVRFVPLVSGDGG